MQSDIFNLDVKDFIRGLITAVLGGVITAAATVVKVGFDIATVDGHALLNLSLSAGAVAGVAYLVKRFLSDDEGRTLGSDSL